MGAAGHLGERLQLEEHPDGGYVGRPQARTASIFGGLLMSQAVQAAAGDVPEGRALHSVRGTFLDRGDGRLPLRYHPTVLREGKRFSVRRVEVEQGEGCLFTATVSFHAQEPGPTYTPVDRIEVPPPESLPAGRYDSRWFDSRDIPAGGASGVAPHARLSWFRARAPLPDDPALHVRALVYLTDHGATRAVREPHAADPRIERRVSVSLDHSVWLHAPARVDEWVLLELHAVHTGAGRGLALGSLRSEDGRLVATVAQEALLRLPDD